MIEDAGKGLDADCVHALARWHDRHDLESRVDDQLRELDRMLTAV
jgi:hypothetical protein